MHDLEIVWPSGKATFTSADSPILIGRSSSANVVLSQGSVSRKHLEIAWEGHGWTVTDPSTHGTFDPIGVKLSKKWTITTSTAVRVGGTEGVEVRFNVARTEALLSEPEVGSWDRIPIDGVDNVGGWPDSTVDQANGGPPPVKSDLAPAVGNIGASFDQVSSQPVASAAELDYKPQAVPGQHFSDVPALNRDSGLKLDQPAPAELEREPSLAPLSLEREVPSPDQRTPSPLDYQDAGQQGLGLFDKQPDLNSFDSAGLNRDASGGNALFDDPLLPSVAGASPILESEPAPVDRYPSPYNDDSGAGLSSNGRAPIPALSPDIGPSQRISHAPTNVSEEILRLSVDGQDYSFSPGTEITVGRDRSCNVHLDERHSLVSRRHLRITHQDGSWYLEDFSSKGTFVDDKQLKGRYQAAGAFIAHLGDRDTGTQVRIITAGTHTVAKSRSRVLPVILASLLLIGIAAAAAYFFFLRTDAAAQAEPVDAATAESSTVMLVTIEDGRVASHSSGFMIADDLIVTTRSVTDGTTPSLVGVVDQEGGSTTVAYATSWVASHPYLDLAVLRIATSTRETDGGYVMATGIEQDIELPILGFGESVSTSPGDDIYVTGFPASPNITSTDKGVLRLPESLSASGSLGDFRMWPGCETSSWQNELPTGVAEGANCSDSGNIEQALVTMEMPDGSAGPGSPVLRDGKVVAVVLGEDDEDSSTVHAITTEAFSGWLDEITQAEN